MKGLGSKTWCGRVVEPSRRQCSINDKDQIESAAQQHFPNFPLAWRP